MKNWRSFIAALLLATTAVNTVGCESGPVGGAVAQAADLMANVSPKKIDGKPTDGAFAENMARFSVELFKKSVKDGENSLISPVSVMLALAMAANGADGKTLEQMEALLGGDIRLGELNEYLYSYVKGLPNNEKSKLNIANSIWFRDKDGGLKVNPDFLRKNADYYGASAFGSAFDAKTVNDINNWVKTHTDGMIEHMLDEIDSLDMMFLINAVMFEAEWETVYQEFNVGKGDFINIADIVENVDFMHSNENIYLDDGMATGFVKPYVNSDYSFAALLPNEGVSIAKYVESLTGKGFLDTLNNAQTTFVETSMPKFEYEYKIEMKDALTALGLKDAFNSGSADFGKMAATAGNANLYISRVLHKTFIKVEELGTKAGAVTMIVAPAAGVIESDDIKRVKLDRPFVYAIIDNATNLPVFIGTLMSVSGNA